jgi:hypothetical protein
MYHVIAYESNGYQLCFANILDVRFVLDLVRSGMLF